MDAIIRDFGSYENMKTRLSTATVAVQGSGWGWLVGDLALYFYDSFVDLDAMFSILNIKNI